MKINIIGSGWLAQPLAQTLQADGHDLMLTTTQQDKVAELQNKGLKAIQYELGDQLSEPGMLFDADVLIIACTCKDTTAYDVMLDQLSEQNCKHILYISSTSVYQENQQHHNENSQALNQDSPIWQIEQLMQTHASASIIRFAGLVGPNRHPGNFFAEGKTLDQANAPVNLIHLDDCIGIIKAVIANQAWQQTFNGCADTHPSKADFYQYAAELIGRKPPATTASQTTNFKTVDNQKVKDQLAYEFKHPDVMRMTF